MADLDASDQNVAGGLEEILADCGFTRFEIPTEGPGSTYVVVIVPHIDQVPPEPFDPDYVPDPDREREPLYLDACAAVRVYAVPDAEISVGQRRILERANGVDLTYHIPDHDTVAEDGPESAALLVNEWVSAGEWKDRIAYLFNHEPLTYHGPMAAPDRPSALVTITLPANVWDEVAGRY